MSHFYNINEILRRNAVISVCCGGRGIGKSYGAKTRLVNDYFNKGYEFMYVRRFKDDLISFKTFFNDIAHQWPEWEFQVRDGRAECRFNPEHDDTDEPWEIMGYSTSMSTAHKLKSASFPKVHWILFDEFIAPPESRYISNETTVLYELYSTIDRYQDRVRVIMLANSISLDNPYFNSWGFTANTEFEKYGGNFVVAHYPESTEFRNDVSKTRFGKFILNSATSYANYAMGNQFADASDAFIADVPAGAKPSLAIRSPEVEITLYISEGKYYVRLGLAGDTRAAINCVPKPNERPMPKSHTFIKLLKDKWFNGGLFFESQAARAAFRKLL